MSDDSTPVSEPFVRPNVIVTREEPTAAVRELQERVAFAEQARDNMGALLEQARAQKKTSSERAGRIIAELTQLIRTSVLYMAEDQAIQVRKALDEILGKDRSKA